MKECSSPIQWSPQLPLRLAIQVENRLSPLDSILDAGQVDEQRPLRLRPVPGWIDDSVVIVWTETLVRSVLVHADVRVERISSASGSPRFGRHRRGVWKAG